MKVIIAGTRTLRMGADTIERAADLYENIAGRSIQEVVSGGAEGVDRAGETWANEMRIPVRRFPADWEQHGKAAGPIRNSQMANYADGLLAIYDGRSRGTADMIKKATAMGLLVVEVRLPKGMPQ